MPIDRVTGRLNLWVRDRLYADTLPSKCVRDLAERLATADGFAGHNGSYVTTTAVFCIAAYKVVVPACNTRFFSDMTYFDSSHPTLRTVGNIITPIAREHFDHTLISNDPGAGVRRCLMNPTVFDWDFRGSFRSEDVRWLFLRFIDLIESGHAIEVFDALAARYRVMSKRRHTVPVTTSKVEPDLASMIINQFLQEYPSERVETVAWSAAHERDNNVSRKTLLQSNDKSGVGDIDGDDYTIEVKSAPITLAMLQETCKKAINSGWCNRVTMVSSAFVADTQTSIMMRIRTKYPELTIKVVTLEEFLINAVGGETGRVTWKGLLERISNSVKSLQPIHSDEWNNLIELHIFNRTVHLAGNIFQFVAA